MSRAEFENWCREHFGWDESRFDMHAGEYINGKTFEKWECWQASRDAISVKIPDEHDIGDGTYGVLQDDFAQALDAAGVSYE